ncbi:MAG: hypothetical protein KBD63_07075 [Bacteriovoracaceae bacterium]|nr:hypothetical protein [Bacteriovoracaceae bacterium]
MVVFKKFFLLFCLSLSVQAGEGLFSGKKYFKYQSYELWSRIHAKESENLQMLVDLLAESAKGKEILMLAHNKALKNEDNQRGLLGILSVGRGSLTDTTLSRYFSPHNIHEVSYLSKSRIYINVDLSLSDALLDLAHELTHYLYRDSFNPYVKNFSPSEFIAKTIEGRGGEVDAFLVECQVQKDLFPEKSKDLCSRIKNSEGSFSREKTIKEFYKVGSFFKETNVFFAQYGITSSAINEAQPSFISSAYGTPYPLAAIKEYEQVLQVACQNDWKRISVLKQRRPASLQNTEQEEAWDEMLADYQKRCSLSKTNNSLSST